MTAIDLQLPKDKALKVLKKSIVRNCSVHVFMIMGSNQKEWQEFECLREG
jgi:hypothetical protein